MPYETPPRTQLVAHKGNSGPMPENTLAAINSAIDPMDTGVALLTTNWPERMLPLTKGRAS